MKMQGLEVKSKPKPCALCGAEAALDCKFRKRIVDGEKEVIPHFFVRCSRFRCGFNRRAWAPHRYSEDVDTAIAVWDGRYPDV